MQLSDKEWKTLRDGMADISCWFMGFNAAFPEWRSVRMPPQLNEVEQLINELKRRHNASFD